MIKVGSLVMVWMGMNFEWHKDLSERPYPWQSGIVVEEQDGLGCDTYGEELREKQYKVLVGEKFQWHQRATLKELT